MKFSALLAASLIVVALADCGTPSILTPATGPGTAYPCGVGGVVCSDVDGNGNVRPTGDCCLHGYVCGVKDPQAGCPVGYCCYADWNEDPTNPLGASKGKMQPQFKSGEAPKN